MARQVCSIKDRKLILREPKSGREYEFVFIPQKVADRLREYALKVCNASSDRIFHVSYEAARVMVIKSPIQAGYSQTLLGQAVRW